ncbi:Poly(A)-specific ribonuclease PARN-like [Acorus gramineus]|uniref:Poly(A)-specific ribonuclease PARN-like n=1 Tax=Acorus gramineus TaxID=55184 RepID=A0AAV9B1B7_ACOGR|nr:Poly(A)-specific ribonuclease PARN-like [Acorus gramineus]
MHGLAKSKQASRGAVKMGKEAVVKQVTKRNFQEAVQELKQRIFESDFISISTKKTGSFSSSSSQSRWRRVLPIDTPQTAYLKAKAAAETFELFQFSVCPFRINSSSSSSKVVAFPYNFHLFPRDEMNLNMPSYGFTCHTSHLMSMAQEGFDFNVCINDGISYLSRVQECKAKFQSTIPRICSITSSVSSSMADSLFMERIKSRVQNWRNVHKCSNKNKDDPLVTSLRKLILGGEVYGSRPCLNIDVCSDHQVQLAVKVLCLLSDDIVPLIIPGKGGGPMAVKVVLTSSSEDKNVLLRELQNLEEEQNRLIRGFGTVIDVISSSHKPIVVYNPLDAEDTGIKNQGHNVLRITRMFAQLSSVLKITPAAYEPEMDDRSASLNSYSNIFHPFRTVLQDQIDGEVAQICNMEKMSTENLVFLWGFRGVVSAGVLKQKLQGAHNVFDFECEDSAKALLEVVGRGEFGLGVLEDGLKAAGYEAYTKTTTEYRLAVEDCPVLHSRSPTKEVAPLPSRIARETKDD